MIRTIQSEWQDAILICRKCTKRVKGGFGDKGRTSLAKMLLGAGVGGKKRKAVRGIVETGCLKLCPKQAVVAINARYPERWLLVSPGTDLAEIVTALRIAPQPLSIAPSKGASPSIDETPQE